MAIDFERDKEKNEFCNFTNFLSNFLYQFETLWACPKHHMFQLQLIRISLIFFYNQYVGHDVGKCTDGEKK